MFPWIHPYYFFCVSSGSCTATNLQDIATIGSLLCFRILISSGAIGIQPSTSYKLEATTWGADSQNWSEIAVREPGGQSQALQVVTVSSHRGLWPTAAPGGEEGYSEEARRLLPQAIPMNNEWFSAKEQTTEMIYNIIKFPQITILMIDFRKWSTEGFHCKFLSDHIIIWKPSTECRLLRLGNEGGKLVMDEGDIVKPEQYRWWSS